MGTYFGTVYEPVYTAGIAAGQVSESGTLGYVYAFPIPQTLANINAFTLGAQSVNPDIETIAVATGSWCDPAQQAQAAQTLIDQGADVITQHQDCTKTIVETAEAAGVNSVGYHADASALAPNGWITGSEWDWTALYTDIVQTVIDGKFADSPYNGDYRVGLQTGANPFIQSAFGSMVTPETIELDRRRQGVVHGRRLTLHGPGRQPGRRHRVGRGRDTDLCRHRADGLLRQRASSARRADRHLHNLADMCPHPDSDDRPDVVLVHGVGVGPESFAVTQAALRAAGRRVHGVVRPGYGRGEHAMDLDEQVDLVLDGRGRPATLRRSVAERAGRRHGSGSVAVPRSA